MMVPFVNEPRSPSSFPRSMLTSPRRAIHLLIPSRFIYYSDRNAAMPTTLGNALWMSPPMASSSCAMKETTPSRDLSPSTTPRPPLWKPSRISWNDAPSMEIGIVSFNSGQPTPPPIPPSLVISKPILYSFVVSRVSLTPCMPLHCGASARSCHHRRLQPRCVCRANPVVAAAIQGSAEGLQDFVGLGDAIPKPFITPLAIGARGPKPRRTSYSASPPIEQVNDIAFGEEFELYC